jgi:hypothetical protein
VTSVKSNTYSGPRVDLSLTVQGLPAELADQVKQVQERAPEALQRALVYAVTRQAVFETLNERLSARYAPAQKAL